MPFALPLAATAAAAAAPAAAAASASAGLTATLVSVASQAAVSMAINAAMSLLSPEVGAAGRPVDWTLDPNGPIPFAFGRVGVAGAVIHKRTFGPDKMNYGLVSVLSGAGPIDGYESLYADDLLVTFDANGRCTTPEWAGELFRVSRLGNQPDTWLPTPAGMKNNSTLPSWAASHRASGKAVHMLVMVENSKGSAFPNGEIKPRQVLRGLRCWDPRRDSTYPGGLGPCRLDDPSTWVWLENPAIFALKWALGMWESATGKGTPHIGQQVGGIGSKLAGIDVPAFIAAANVADANGWTCAAYPNSDDDKHQVLVSFLQAAGAIYAQRAGKISCIQRAAPRASVATITADDVVGPIEVDTAASRIARINTITPSYWSPQHRWQITALSEVTAQAYRDQDDGKRGRGVTYPYVTNANQAAQLAALDIANSREGMAGQVALKPHLQSIRPGDAFTISEPGFLLDGVKCLCMNTEYDPAEAVVRVTFISETDAKYPFALGQSTVPPTPPTLTAREPVSPPLPEDWVIVPRPPAPGGSQQPSFDLEGIVSNETATAIIVETGPTADGPWTQAYQGPPTVTRIQVDSLQPGATYYVAIQYQRDLNYSARQVSGPYIAPNFVSGDTAHIGGRPTPVMVQQLDDILIDVDALAVDVGEVVEGVREVRSLVASSGYPSMNPNPVFGKAWNSGQFPPDWQDWATGWDNNRVAGIESQNGFQISVPAVGTVAQAARGLFQPNGAGTLGTAQGEAYYVQELTIRLDAGSLLGAGSHLQFYDAAGAIIGSTNVNCAADKPLGQLPPGDGVVGQVYRYSKLFKTPPGTRTLVPYAMAFWEGYWNVAPVAKTVTITKCLIRPADPAEIESGEARGSFPSVVARLSNEEITRASETASLATRSAKLEAGAVALPNLLKNSDFSQGLRNWTVLSGTWHPQYNQNIGSYIYCTDPGGAWYISSDLIPVYPSQPYTLSLSGDGGAGTDAPWVYLSCYDAAGNYIPAGDGIALVAVNDRNWENRKSAAGVTHPSAAFVKVIVAKRAETDGIHLSRIMLNAGSLPRNWTDQATARDVAGRVATSEGVLASITGKVQAWWQKVIQAGDGTAFIQATATDDNGNVTSEVAFGARKIGMFTQVGNGWVEVLKLIGTSAHFAGKVFIGGLKEITLDPDLPGITWKIGGANLVIGRLPNQNMIFWFGPAMDTAAMTKANATFWLDSVGNAYFGGSLSSGILKNTSTTSSLATNPSTETAVFGSNGGSIAVNLSFSYEASQHAQGNNPRPADISGGNSAVVKLYRSVNGSAYVEVATLNVGGTWQRQYYDNGTEPGQPNWFGSLSSFASGSVTYTDGLMSAQNRQYRAEVFSQSITRLPSGTQVQRLSIITTEG